MERQIIAERPDKTVFVQNGLCYKMFEPGYSKSTILSEALNQGLVEETGLNIPGLLEVTKRVVHSELNLAMVSKQQQAQNPLLSPFFLE